MEHKLAGIPDRCIQRGAELWTEGHPLQSFFEFSGCQTGSFPEDFDKIALAFEAAGGGGFQNGKSAF